MGLIPDEEDDPDENTHRIVWICVQLAQSLHGGYAEYANMPLPRLMRLWEAVCALNERIAADKGSSGSEGDAEDDDEA